MFLNMGREVVSLCSYKTVRTNHPFVKELQDTAVIIRNCKETYQKKGAMTDEYIRTSAC